MEDIGQEVEAGRWKFRGGGWEVDCWKEQVGKRRSRDGGWEMGAGKKRLGGGGWEDKAGVWPSHQVTAGAWPRVWGRVGPKLMFCVNE